MGCCLSLRGYTSVLLGGFERLIRKYRSARLCLALCLTGWVWGMAQFVKFIAQEGHLDPVYFVLAVPCLVGFMMVAVFYYLESPTVEPVSPGDPHNGDDTPRLGRGPEVREGERYTDPHKLRCLDLVSDRVVSRLLLGGVFAFVVLAAAYAAFLPQLFFDPPASGGFENVKMSTPYYQTRAVSRVYYNEIGTYPNLQALLTDELNSPVSPDTKNCNCALTLRETQANGEMRACCYRRDTYNQICRLVSKSVECPTGAQFRSSVCNDTNPNYQIYGYHQHAPFWTASFVSPAIARVESASCLPNPPDFSNDILHFLPILPSSPTLLSTVLSCACGDPPLVAEAVETEAGTEVEAHLRLVKVPEYAKTANIEFTVEGSEPISQAVSCYFPHNNTWIIGRGFGKSHFSRQLGTTHGFDSGFVMQGKLLWCSWYSKFADGDLPNRLLPPQLAPDFHLITESQKSFEDPGNSENTLGSSGIGSISPPKPREIGGLDDPGELNMEGDPSKPWLWMGPNDTVTACVRASFNSSSASATQIVQAGLFVLSTDTSKSPENLRESALKGIIDEIAAMGGISKSDRVFRYASGAAYLLYAFQGGRKGGLGGITSYQAFTTLHDNTPSFLQTPMEAIFDSPLEIRRDPDSQGFPAIQAFVTAPQGGVACFDMQVEAGPESYASILFSFSNTPLDLLSEKSLELSEPILIRSPITDFKILAAHLGGERFRRSAGSSQNRLDLNPPGLSSFHIHLRVAWDIEYLKRSPKILGDLDLAPFRIKQSLQGGGYKLAVYTLERINASSNSSLERITFTDLPRGIFSLEFYFYGKRAKVYTTDSPIQDPEHLEALFNSIDLSQVSDSLVVGATGKWYPGISPLKGLSVWLSPNFIAIFGMFWLLCLPLIVVNALSVSPSISWMLTRTVVSVVYLAFLIDFWAEQKTYSCQPDDMIRDYVTLRKPTPTGEMNQCRDANADASYLPILLIPLTVLVVLLLKNVVVLLCVSRRRQPKELFPRVVSFTVKIAAVIFALCRFQVLTLQKDTAKATYSPFGLAMNIVFFQRFPDPITGKVWRPITMLLLSTSLYLSLAPTYYPWELYWAKILHVALIDAPAMGVVWYWTEINIDQQPWVHVWNLLSLCVILGANLALAYRRPPTSEFQQESSERSRTFREVSEIQRESPAVTRLASGVALPAVALWAAVPSITSSPGLWTSLWTLTAALTLTFDLHPPPVPRPLRNLPKAARRICLILLSIAVPLSLSLYWPIAVGGLVVFGMGFIFAGIRAMQAPGVEPLGIGRHVAELMQKEVWRTWLKLKHFDPGVWVFVVFIGFVSLAVIMLQIPLDFDVLRPYITLGASLAGLILASYILSTLQTLFFFPPPSNIQLGTQEYVSHGDSKYVSLPKKSPIRGKRGKRLKMSRNEDGKGMENEARSEIGYVRSRGDDAMRYVKARLATELLQQDSNGKFRSPLIPLFQLRIPSRWILIKVWVGEYWRIVPYIYFTYETKSNDAKGGSMADLLRSLVLTQDKQAVIQEESKHSTPPSPSQAPPTPPPTLAPPQSSPPPPPPPLDLKYKILESESPTDEKNQLWKSGPKPPPMAKFDGSRGCNSAVGEGNKKNRFDVEEELCQVLLDLVLVRFEKHPLDYYKTPLVIIAALTAASGILLVCFVVGINGVNWLAYIFKETYLNDILHISGFRYYPLPMRYQLGGEVYQVLFHSVGYTFWFLDEYLGVPLLIITDAMVCYVPYLSLLSVASGAMLLWRLYFAYKRHILRLRKGNYWFKPKEVFLGNDSMKMITIVMFNTLCIYWITFWVVLAIITFSAVSYYVKPLRFRVIEPFLRYLGVTYAMLVLIQAILYFLGKNAFSKKDSPGFITRNLTYGVVGFLGFTIWWSFAVQVLALKLITWILTSPLAIFNIQYPASPLYIPRLLDVGLLTYYSVLLMDHHHNNPFVLTFVSIATEIIQKRKKYIAKFPRTATGDVPLLPPLQDSPTTVTTRRSRGFSAFSVNSHRFSFESRTSRRRRRRATKPAAKRSAAARSKFRWWWVSMLARHSLLHIMRKDFRNQRRRQILNQINKLELGSRVCLRRSFLTTSDVIALADILKSYPITANNVISLDLSRNPQVSGKRAGAAIARIIQACQNLEELDISWTDLNDRGIKSLAKSLLRSGIQDSPSGTQDPPSGTQSRFIGTQYPPTIIQNRISGSRKGRAFSGEDSSIRSIRVGSRLEVRRLSILRVVGIGITNEAAEDLQRLTQHLPSLFEVEVETFYPLDQPVVGSIVFAKLPTNGDEKGRESENVTPLRARVVVARILRFDRRYGIYVDPVQSEGRLGRRAFWAMEVYARYNGVGGMELAAIESASLSNRFRLDM